MAVGDRNAPTIDDDVQPSPLRVAASVGSRRRRAVRHARRHRRRITSSRPTAITRSASIVEGGVGTRARGHRRLDRRRARRAAPLRDGRRAGDAASADAPHGADYIRTEPILVKAGQQRVVRRVRAPHRRAVRRSDQAARLVDARRTASASAGITTLPHVRDLDDHRARTRSTGVSDTPSREKIFTLPADDAPPKSGRARRRSSRGSATRGVPASAHARTIAIALMAFYDSAAREAGGFEEGIRTRAPGDAREPVLRVPRRDRAGQRRRRAATTGSATSISRRGCRSSSGARIPDDELLTLAAQNTLSDAGDARAAGARMLADPRAEALVDALRRAVAAAAGRRQDPPGRAPVPRLRPAARRRDAARDRAVLRQHRARGPQRARPVHARTTRSSTSGSRGTTAFRTSRATSSAASTYPDDTRRGLLGQGSILVQTSLADRTSPVLRGKWVMEVLLGIAAAAAAAERAGARRDRATRKDGKLLTTRERMEKHRKNPACNVVPPVHRSDRPRARQLRRHRRVARSENGDAARHARRRCTTARRSRRRPSCAQRAAQAADAAGAHLHREPDGLRARPPRRVLRPADDSRDRHATPKRTTTACRRSSWASSTAPRSGCKTSRAASPATHEQTRSARPQLEESRHARSSPASTFPAARSCRAWARRWRCRCSTRWCRRAACSARAAAAAAADKTRLVVHRDGARRGRQQRDRGAKKNLWAPAAVGRDFDLDRRRRAARRSSRSATT